MSAGPGPGIGWRLASRRPAHAHAAGLGRRRSDPTRPIPERAALDGTTGQARPRSTGTGDQATGIGHRTPRTQHRAPRIGHQAPGVAYRASAIAHGHKNRHLAPAAGHRAPATGHQPPGIRRRTPDTGHRAPGTGHRAPGTAAPLGASSHQASARTRARRPAVSGSVARCPPAEPRDEGCAQRSGAAQATAASRGRSAAGSGSLRT